MVLVRCYTFNHAPYITDALNGFCMQETTFPFVCTIVDDASTDGEQEVIKKYLQEHFDLEDSSVVRNEETDDYVLTFARHKTNKNCYFAVLYLKYNHYSIKKAKMPYIKEWQDQVRYIALCEGDDYWIHPEKLQKQFETLENNATVTLVHTGFSCVDESGNQIRRKFYEKIQRESYSGNFLPMMFKSNHIMTLTTMYRKNITDSKLYVDSPSRIDYTLSLCASSLGDIFFLSDLMGAYRSSPNGLMLSKRTRVDESLYMTYKYYSVSFIDGRLRNVELWSDIRICYYIIKMALSKKDNDLIDYMLKRKRWVRPLYHLILLYKKCL